MLTTAKHVPINKKLLFTLGYQKTSR